MPELLLNVSTLNVADHISLEARGRSKLLGMTRIPAAHGVSLRRLYVDWHGAAAYVLWPSGAELLLKRARRVLRKAGGLASYTYPIDSFSHAVGTLRCGTTAEQSVLDADCRYWGAENLYVVDGAFMPSSGGVNPSLTIAANALRVAEKMVESAV